MSIDRPIKVMIIDDHSFLMAGLRLLIEKKGGMDVVSGAAQENSILAVAARELPDVVLIDLDLGGEESFNLIPMLLAQSERVRVIALTASRNPEVHQRAVGAGAVGLVMKELAVDMLIKAIEKVCAGEVWLERTLVANVLNKITRTNSAAVATNPETVKISSLTKREREVIKLVAQGLNRKSIAARLYISDSTVRNHLTSIFMKLGLSDRFELAFYAYRHGIAKPPE